MPEEPYSTKIVDGEEYWIVECLVPKESDPERGAYIFFAKPMAGVTGIAGLIKGDAGKHTIIDPAIDFTALEYSDPTPDSADFVETVPGSDTTSQKVKLHLALHKGKPGDDGDTVLTPSDYGTPNAKDVLQVNDAGSGFELVQQRVVRSHWPGSLSNAPAGTTATFQIGVISIAAGVYKAPYRLHINAGATVIGSSSDLKVDIVARLGATDGPIIGYGAGIAGIQTQRTIVISGPPAGTSASNADYFAAGGAASTVYLMSEKKSGAATYSTTEPWFSVDVESV